MRKKDARPRSSRLFLSTKTMEPSTVVLDRGRALTRFGFAGEAAPRGVERTPDLDAAAFVRRLFARKLLRDAGGARVVLVVDPLGAVQERDALLAALFEGPAPVERVTLVPAAVAPLYALHLETALVIDLGADEVRVFPVYERAPIQGAARAFDGGAAAALEFVKTELELADRAAAEDVFVRACHAAPEMGQASAYGDLVLDGSLPTVPARVRTGAVDRVFEENEDGESLVQTIVEAVMASPIDVRRPLLHNVVVTGGLSAIPGVTSRLRRDLAAAAGHLAPSVRLAASKLLPSHLWPWIGASIAGTIDHSDAFRACAVSAASWRDLGVGI